MCRPYRASYEQRFRGSVPPTEALFVSLFVSARGSFWPARIARFTHAMKRARVGSLARGFPPLSLTGHRYDNEESLMERIDLWQSLKYFRREEFTDPDEMSLDFLYLLNAARGAAGVPFRVSSSYRDDDENSAHMGGVAVDIKCTMSRERMRILAGLLRVGFRRIGIYRNHVHVDLDRTKEQDVLWYGRYVSEG